MSDKGGIDPFATQYVQGIYIPCSLLIVGVLIVKKEWLPYAVALAVLLGSYKIYVNRTYSFIVDIIELVS